QSAGKARETNLVSDDTKDGQLDSARIPELPADGRLDEIHPAVNSAAASDKDKNKVTFDNVADVNEGLSWRGEFSAETGKDFAEHRHNFDQEENGDQDRHDGHDSRIHHGGLDLLTRALGIFEIGGQSCQ